VLLDDLSVSLLFVVVLAAEASEQMLPLLLFSSLSLSAPLAYLLVLIEF